MAKVAFGLIRVSTSEQKMDAQREALRKIAKKQGYVIDDDDFFEEQISGYDEDDSTDRDSIIRLEEQILLRKPDAVFVKELSRLTRRAIKVQRYIDRLSVNTKVPMYFADYDVWTLDTETKKPIDNNIMILVGGAKSVEIERERIKERTSSGRDAKAEKGYFVGHLADGYTWEYDDEGEKRIIRDEERAPLIERIFELYVEQEYSTGMIRDYLNADIEKYPPTNLYRKKHPNLFKGYKDNYKDRSGNIKSREDLYWADSSIAQILRDEWYKGTRYYHDNPYPVEAIVDVSLWERAQERLAALRFVGLHTTRQYLLTGKMYCGICGRKMYGHGDGYNNMYYCSSQEFGNKNKCGLRWIRQESVESILFNIIKARATEDIRYGDKTVFSDYFEQDSKRAKKIDSDIKVHNRIIARAEAEINNLQKQIEFCVQQQVKYMDNPQMISVYDKQMEGLQGRITEQEALKRTHSIEINKLKKQKKILLSVAEKLSKLSTMTDFDELKALLSAVVDRVFIYNPDKTSSLIKILYSNGECDYAIYNPTRLKRRFVFLSQDYQNRMKMTYDNHTKEISFSGFYLGLRSNSEVLFNEQNDTSDLATDYRGAGRISLGTWNTPENKERYMRDVDEAIAKGLVPKSARGEYEQSYQMAVEEGLIWNDIQHAIQCLNDEGYRVYKDSVPVIDYVNVKREKGALHVYSFEDLLPMTEEGIRRRNYHREYYRKKYNTGKPSSPEYIEKDADYERISKERKHLYNRKYKILNNKHLTEEQKEEKIFRIMEQLEAYKYQLKYLPTNKKGELAIKKYNSKKEE